MWRATYSVFCARPDYVAGIGTAPVIMVIGGVV
jgi:hypothetical protein